MLHSFCLSLSHTMSLNLFQWWGAFSRHGKFAEQQWSCGEKRLSKPGLLLVCVSQKCLILWQRVVQDRKEAKKRRPESQNGLGWSKL